MQIPALGDDQLSGESMLEEIRRTAEERLQQIEPLLEEAERLRGVLEVLGRRTAPADGAALRRATGEKHARAGRTRRDGSAPATAARQSGTLAGIDAEARAAKGSNKRAIMQLVAQKPGITAAQIAQLTGMKRTVAASTVSRLKRSGELLDHEGGGVCLPPKPIPTRSATAALAPDASRPTGSTTRRQRPRRLAPPLPRRAA